MALPGYDNIEGLSNRAAEAIPRFLQSIKQIGFNRPIKSIVLERNWGISGPEIRAIISHLRCEG